MGECTLLSEGVLGKAAGLWLWNCTHRSVRWLEQTAFVGLVFCLKSLVFCRVFFFRGGGRLQLGPRGGPPGGGQGVGGGGQDRLPG